MKKLLLVTLSLVALIALVQPIKADVFASGIKFTNPDDSPFDGNPADGTPAKIHFLLNDTASTVTIRIQNASGDVVVHTIIEQGLSAGWHSVTWDGTGSGGSGTFYATIEAAQTPRSTTDYSVYTFIPTSSTTYTIFSRGVDAIRQQTNPYYGYFYTANAGGALKRGLCFYTADGWFAGTDPGSPVLTPALSEIDGGTTPWSNDITAPVFATTDYLGRVYASDFTKGEVWRTDGPASTPKRIISGLTSPAGLAVSGEGATFRIYIAAGMTVVRADIGTDDTLTTTPVVVASLDNMAHDVALDDEGFLYVNLRGGTGWDGDGTGATEQYDISGTLPVTPANKIWTYAWNGRPNGMAVWSGASTATANDDILYVSVRGDGIDAAAPGVHLVEKLHDPFLLGRRGIFTPNDIVGSHGSGGGNVSGQADLTVDPVGNVIFWENGNEEIIMLSPPSSAATVSQTTKSSGTMTLGATSVHERPEVPATFTLGQNFPNPFNPTTNISFTLETSGQTALRVYDVLGREVAVLVNDVMPEGSFQVTFNARELRSGTYFYTLQHGGKMVTKKMALVR